MSRLESGMDFGQGLQDRAVRMIGRKKSRNTVEENVDPKGFDDFALRLGDMMRGERATMGKSLLDVQRELRIKASYIAAIENCDPTAFDTPGFIAGYVRSYARYLDMDPDRAFAAFCEESGFSTAHGMSSEASSRSTDTPIIAAQTARERDPFATPSTPFAPASEALFSRIEPGAIGSSLVLLALIGTIGFGGWTVLNEVQRVQFAPVENTPDVLSDLDPLVVGTQTPVEDQGPQLAEGAQGVFSPPADALDRLYRPQALDVPVLVARDAPISTLDPSTVGTFRPQVPDQYASVAQAAADVAPAVPQVIEGPAPALEMVAVRPAWVRVRGADGTVIFEGIMNAGDRYDIPATEEPPTLRVGESGAIYFAVNGTHYGPAGPRGTVTSALPLSQDHLTASYEPADLQQDRDLARMVAQAQSVAVDPE